jgi:hypothetical protein
VSSPANNEHARVSDICPRLFCFEACRSPLPEPCHGGWVALEGRTPSKRVHGRISNFEGASCTESLRTARRRSSGISAPFPPLAHSTAFLDKVALKRLSRQILMSICKTAYLPPGFFTRFFPNAPARIFTEMKFHKSLPFQHLRWVFSGVFLTGYSLEMLYGGNSIEGSNPSLSARRCGSNSG